MTPRITKLLHSPLPLRTAYADTSAVTIVSRSGFEEPMARVATKLAA